MALNLQNFVTVEGKTFAVSYKVRPGSHAANKVANLLECEGGAIVTRAFGRTYRSALDNAVESYRIRRRQTP